MTATSVLATEDMSAQNGNQQEEALAGDANCGGLVDGVDALLILRFAAFDETSDCLRMTANVVCDDGLGSADANAILRYTAGFLVELPSGCPAIGESIFTPPEVSLACDSKSIIVSHTVNCQYSAFSYIGDVYLAWNLADGLEVGIDPPALGIVCAPDGVPCWYSAWGSMTVAFRYPSEKVIALTACANTKCVVQVWRLTVVSGT